MESLLKLKWIAILRALMKGYIEMKEGDDYCLGRSEK